MTLENFSGQAGDLPKLMSVGDVFNVVGEVLGGIYGQPPIQCWDLEPWANEPFVFDKRNFAILPDEPAELIDESIEEPQLVTV